MTDQRLPRDAFDRIAKRHGFAAPDDNVQLGYNPWVVLRRFVQTVEADLKIGRYSSNKMELQVGVTNATSVNAFATHLEGVDVIGINIGLFQKITAIPEALLSHPSFFPNLGSTEGLTPFIADTDWVRGGIDHSYRTPERIVDPTRAKLAAHIMQTALLIIFRHEFAHIWNGHVDWLRAYKAIASYEEVSSNESRLIGIDALTFEWDADKMLFQML